MADKYSLKAGARCNLPFNNGDIFDGEKFYTVSSNDDVSFFSHFSPGEPTLKVGGRGVKAIIKPIISRNFMKMKEIGPGRGASS